MTSFTQLGGSQTTVDDYTMLKVPSFTYNIWQRKKLLNDVSLVNEHCDFTKNIASKYIRITEARRSIQLCTGNGSERKTCRPQYSAVDDYTMLKVPSFTYNIDTKA